MTIDLATGEAGTSNVSLAVDLTLLGAVSADAFEKLGTELPVEYANYPQLASCAHAAARGGIDFVCLSKDFHARSDTPNALDGVRIAARLLSQEAGHVSAQIPLNGVDDALEILREGTEAASVSIALEEGYNEEALREAAQKIHAQGILVELVLSPRDFGEQDFHFVGQIADRVRLLTDDAEEARAARSVLMRSAREADKELRVFGELGIVISGSMLAANERALLVEAMTGEPLFHGKTSVVGTVYDVADAIERWVGMGAVDGMVMIPASLPSDLASVIRGVIPLLQARAAE